MILSRYTKGNWHISFNRFVTVPFVMMARKCPCDNSSYTISVISLGSKVSPPPHRLIWAIPPNLSLDKAAPICFALYLNVGKAF